MSSRWNGTADASATGNLAGFQTGLPAIETRVGDTALAIGGGITARVNQNLSFYGQARYRWSVDGARGSLTAIAGTLGLRANW